MTEWETIDVPRGAYISWGETTGQHVTGRVLEYSENGGTDFSGNTCPTVTIELTDKSASVNKAGVRTNFDSGEVVQLNAGQVSLKRALRAAKPNNGDMVKITLENMVRTANGTVKEFGIKIARSNGSQSVVAATEVTDDCPF